MAQPNNYNSQRKKSKRKRKKNKKYNQYHQKQEYHQHSNNEQKQAVPNDELLIIDGSMMEGGGQIIRNSIAFAALMKKAIHITKIRGKRSNPGLRKQHSKGIELVRKINGGFVDGNYVKSMAVKYYPSDKPSFINTYQVDIETAGSVCLLMQTVLPLLIFTPLSCMLSCIGGTNASFAPQIDYFELILQPMLKRLMDIDIEIQCKQRGFFPKGGGKIILKTQPIKTFIPCFDLMKRGQILQIYGRVIVGGKGLKITSGNDVVKGAVRELQRKFGQKISIKINVVEKNKIDSYSNGIGIVIVLETDTGCLFGGSALSKHNNNNYAEIGRVAARELITDWNSTKSGCSDRWLQDQLIIFMALAKGKSRMATCAMELHTKTAIYIAELLTGVNFIVSTMNDGTVLIECEGIGYTTGFNADDSKVDNDHDDDDSNKQKGDSFLKNRPSLF